MMSGDAGRSAPAVAAQLVALSTAILPVWARHLAQSRSQSEAAVAEMIAAFAEIGPHLNQAARQSQQIGAALSHGQDGVMQLAHACEKELAPLLGIVEASSAGAIGRVLSMIQASVRALEQVAKPFEHETQMVSRLIDRMYVGFQYQDRINQMMSLLHEDISRLKTLLDDPACEAQALSQATWLARLESQYAMVEQYDRHGASAASSGSPAPGTDSEADFF